MSELTAKQARFVNEYIRTQCKQQVRHKRTGYSCK